MPRRPLPVLPRGPRRRARAAGTLLFACPRIAPDWELAALRALMKPQARGAIQHRKATQAWPASAEALVRTTCHAVRERVGYGPQLHFPDGGDFHFVAELDGRELDAAKGFAAVVSSRLPTQWFVFGRLFLRKGHFFRRQFGYKLNLVPASNVHLSRGVRAALRPLLVGQM
jgi:hypothetical protein